MNLKCVFALSLQLFSETFIILRRTERDMVEMFIGTYVKYRKSCRIIMKLEFSRQDLK